MHLTRQQKPATEGRAGAREATKAAPKLPGKTVETGVTRTDVKATDH